MDSDDDDSEHGGPNDHHFFIDNDIHAITTTQLGIYQETLDDLFTGETYLVLPK